MEDMEKKVWNFVVNIKNKTPTTCDNEKCKYIGDIYFCYNGEERLCGLYKQWEKKLMRNSGRK